jgi:spoIIIJ-associated protein
VSTGIPDDASAAERVRAVVERVVAEMELDASVEVSESDGEILASVESDDLGRLIGRHGQTLDALQLLCYRAANAREGDRVRVTVDAGGYREHQREVLHREADAAARRVLDEKVEVRLEPMSSTERRIVHNRLADRSGIETYSEGTEPERVVVVAPLVSG